jgi:hypothetical protein
VSKADPLNIEFGFASSIDGVELAVWDADTREHIFSVTLQPDKARAVAERLTLNSWSVDTLRAELGL